MQIHLENQLEFMRFFVLCLICVFFFSPSYAYNGDGCALHSEEDYSNEALEFVINKGQFDPSVYFECYLGGMDRVYLQDRKWTYVFHDDKQIEGLHDFHHELRKSKKPEYLVDGHAFEVEFIGASQTQPRGFIKQKKYYNYFLGDDESKWAGHVNIFRETMYTNLYPGIDLMAYSKDGFFKYDFIVAPKADPNDIQISYSKDVSLRKNGEALHISTSVKTVMELEPFAFQIIDGKLIQVECQYVLSDNLVSFKFKNGYDEEYPLIIDPTVIGATLTGTVGNRNFGHTASYDNAGNMYIGGISFGPGLPTNLGSFQQNFGGGLVDIGVCKFNENGSQLIYTTYLGGESSDYPHSIIVDNNQQLSVFGSSESIDYPTTSNAFQNIKSGLDDIIVSKLNADGSDLVGSTFIGGSDVDGINQSDISTNYGEDFRGEIILDQQGNIVIATCTSSSDFPVTSNAFQSQYNGNTSGGFNNIDQDGVILKLNSDLSDLFWATYLGGDDADTAFGLRIGDFGEVYVTGTAGHSNFPVTPGTLMDVWPGGEENAYVAILSADGSSLLRGSFWGTDGNDHSYFLDIDEERNVHIYGQTTGVMPISPNTFSSPVGSPQFIAALNVDLTELVYSTVIGNGPPVNEPFTSPYDFVPVAFMVDKCNGIYFSGYYAVGGLPVTADAVEVLENAIYIGNLAPNAESLKFGTYYGDADHVDGGTSRFDKSGVVYQGVCSCTSGDRILNCTPDAWATDQAEFCDMGVFKIDFEIKTVTAAATVFPSTSGCAPFAVDFEYTGQDGITFLWDYDGLDSSVQENPSYVFEEPGTYQILMIAENLEACNIRDTAYVQIDVLDGTSTTQEVPICPGIGSTFLDVTTQNANYNWQDGSTGATFQVSEPGIYWVDVFIDGCSRRDSFFVSAESLVSLDLGPDQLLCDEMNFQLDVEDPNADNYLWSTGEELAIINVDESDLYIVSVTDTLGCIIKDSIEIVFSTTPEFELNDTILCPGASLVLDMSALGTGFMWQDGNTNPSYTLSSNGLFWVEVNNNGCYKRDSLELTYAIEPGVEINHMDLMCFEECLGSASANIPAEVVSFQWDFGSQQSEISDLCAGDYTLSFVDGYNCPYEKTIEISQPDPLNFELDFEDLVCYGDLTGSISILNSEGGVGNYQFSIGNGFSEETFYDALSGGDYLIQMMDSNNCLTEQNIFIYEPPQLDLFAGDDVTIQLGDSIDLNATLSTQLNQSILWTPPLDLSCDDCLNPTASPLFDQLYTITATDSITGCEVTDRVLVDVFKELNVYVPNVFTPNGDGNNDWFTVFGNYTVTSVIYMNVYDRWGNLVFTKENFLPNDPLKGWDGTMKNKPLNPAVFAYITEVQFLDGTTQVLKGDISLVR